MTVFFIGISEHSDSPSHTLAPLPGKGCHSLILHNEEHSFSEPFQLLDISLMTGMGRKKASQRQKPRLTLYAWSFKGRRQRLVCIYCKEEGMPYCLEIAVKEER